MPLTRNWNTNNAWSDYQTAKFYSLIDGNHKLCGNILNPSWKAPTGFASRNQLADALMVCRKAAWVRDEEERIKNKKEKTIDNTVKEFDKDSTFKEYSCFRHLGLPAGERGCLKIFNAPLSGNGPSQMTKKPLNEWEQMDATGSRDQKRLCGLKTEDVKTEKKV
jgi:hypothetical protein